MAIRCPYCLFEMELKGARPGRFAPKCAACGEKFTLVVSPNPKVSPTVLKAVDEVYDDLSSGPTTVVASGGAPIATTMLPPPELAAQKMAPGAIATVPPPASVPQPSATVTLAPPTAPAPLPVSDGSTEPPPTSAKAVKEEPLRGSLGGYELIERLGQGGMGAVYLARQVSLDRNVALKILSPTLATDPQFVARFTREAFAAAQLTHHNIVQIHDIGAEGSIHYFSMEFVDGDTLAKVVRDSGKLDAEAAASFVLQAARGLKYAHEHGMIHRDIKPDNLIVNDLGMLKVADLGLVKRSKGSEFSFSGVAPTQAEEGQTQFNVSMGTPAYMSPEQAWDAARVDQRADIYSLGCTLYDLLTGRPPFMGRTAQQIMSKHQREPLTPPDMIVRSVPKTLSMILVRMTNKRPEDRYQTMNEVIRALEDFLGVATAGPLTPRPEHAATLESAVSRFNKSSWAVLRWQIMATFFAACGIGIAALAFTSHPLWAATVLGIAVLTAISYQVTIGITQRAYLFTQFRQLIFGSGLLDWMLWLIMGMLVITILSLLGWIGQWFAAGLVAMLLAAAFHFSVDMLRDRERAAPIEQVETMLKQMRLRGLDEMTLRQFVCKYSGRHWEEFFEALFGYEAKIRARQLWNVAEKSRNRPQFAAWRDPIIRWIETRQAIRREKREQRLLRKVETQALTATGVSEPEAEEKAKIQARKMMSSAARLRSTSVQRAAATAAPAGQQKTIQQFITIIAPSLSGKLTEADAVQTKSVDEHFEREHLSWFRRRFGTPIDLLLGNHIRFLLAVALLLGFAIWWHQNKGIQALDRAAQVVSTHRELEITNPDMKKLSGEIKTITQNAASDAQIALNQSGTRPLDMPMLPFMVRRALSGWNAAIAGIILLISIFCTGRLMAITVILAAAIALVGHWYPIPGYGSLQPWMTAAAASILGFVGLLFFRTQEL